ncbi:hypothetical protein AAFF_G00398900 [Aldrovandia affinis]|uniref:Uncharacterized protein n=1 Tax=Aldrovandia affinis TaxID=143900 RepID=A0AAD7WKC0_9TELE|nr:hypothetical protein AAFF_G00398900 [Aldrovandia affinis]
MRLALEWVDDVGVPSSPSVALGPPLSGNNRRQLGGSTPKLQQRYRCRTDAASSTLCGHCKEEEEEATEQTWLVQLS